MDKSQFPQEDGFLNQDPAPVPDHENLPEEPEIMELSFTPESSDVQSGAVSPLPEEASESPDSDFFEKTVPDLPEDPLPEDPFVSPEDSFSEASPISPEDPFVEAMSPSSHEDTAAFPESSTPSDSPAQPSFMERIPDVEDDPGEATPAFHGEPLETPAMGEPLIPDDEALNYHGILKHGEEEPPFDLSILEDPELRSEPEESEALAASEAEPDDQEYRDGGKDFEEAMEAPAPQPKTPAHSRPVRKGRPRKKKGEGLLGIPNILATVVWLALILAIGVTAGRMLWVCAADVLAFGRENKPVTITVYEADTMDTITDKLYNAGLIRYKSLFQLYASISDAEEKIQPGIYDLNTLYDYHALVNFMTPRSSREVIELTIPEGYTCRQIFDLLEENRVCTAQDVAAYAADGELKDYWFLESVARGDKYCLEGFLFPDTYEFYKNSTPREALERMLNNFEKRFSEEMRAQIDTLNETVTGGGYTVREVTIVASLIEKESAAPAESPSIAGVIYNRLHNWDGTPAYLNIDAAIIYAQDGNAETIDTRLDSPYNTYTHTGLTPTPISNPGLSSLQAALQPESHNYYYYVLNPSTGMHQFSTTQEEHNAYIAEFYPS